MLQIRETIVSTAADAPYIMPIKKQRKKKAEEEKAKKAAREAGGFPGSPAGGFPAFLSSLAAAVPSLEKSDLK